MFVFYSSEVTKTKLFSGSESVFVHLTAFQVDALFTYMLKTSAHGGYIKQQFK